MSDSDLSYERAIVMEKARREANREMRKVFMGSSDTVIGARMSQMRQQFGEQAAALLHGWEPLDWSVGDRKLSFEIGQNAFMALGEDAVDPRIDEIVVDAVVDAMMSTPTFTAALLHDILVSQNESGHMYDLEDRGSDPGWFKQMTGRG